MTTSFLTRNRSRSRFVAGLVVVALFGAGIPASAQTQDIEQAKAEREAARSDAATTASELDPLLAEDAELVAAVLALELHVETQQAKLDSAQQALASSEVEAVVAADRVLDMQLELGGLRARLQATAVEAYITPDDQRIGTLFSSDDITVAAHKQALLDTIATSEVDLLDRLRAAEGQLDDLRAQADAAVLRVEDERRAEATQLAAVEEALDAEQRVKAALESRIVAFVSQIDGLAADEARLTSLITSLIADEEARIAAEEAALRRAEEQRRLAEEAAKRAEEEKRNPKPAVPTPAPLPAPESSGDVIWPSGGVVTSEFGPRWGRMHNALDISAAAGSPIVAAQSGSVITAKAYGAYGNMVVIDHGGGFTTVYAHLDQIQVSVGQSVGQGAQIGTMGCSGSCTGPHVHFETRVNGVPQNPRQYL